MTWGSSDPVQATDARRQTRALAPQLLLLLKLRPGCYDPQPTVADRPSEHAVGTSGVDRRMDKVSLIDLAMVYQLKWWK